MTIQRAAIPTLLIATLSASLACAQLPKVDRNGDPLPASAIARLGTLRWRTTTPIEAAVFLDDNSVFTVNQHLMTQVWDVATGKELSRRGILGAAVAPVYPRIPSAPHVRHVVVSGNGRRIAYTTSMESVGVFDVPSGKLLRD